MLVSAPRSPWWAAGAFSVGSILIGAGLAMPTASAVSAQVPHAIGRLQITCKYVGSNNDDFLVFPGRLGASHVHDYFGAKGVTAMSTATSITGRGTSCPNAADESAYWAPSLIINGTTYPPTAGHFYYERSTDAKVEELPAGFSMIVGSARSTSDDTGNSHIFFGCAHSVVKRSTRVDFETCSGTSNGSSSDRNTFVIWLEFPNCWAGGSTGKPNMSYATGSDAKCSGRLLPTVRYALWYDLPARLSVRGAKLSSGPMGSSHADFVNGWSTEGMRSMTDCLNRGNRRC